VGGLQQDGGGALVASDGFLASRIATIWGEVLGLEAVTVEADFFELGGDSLAAVRMLAAVEEAISVPVSFTDFLERPTVGALADAVARKRGGPQDPPPAPSRNGASDGPARLSFGQERLWFLEQLGGSTAAYNMAIGVRMRGPVDVDALRRALLQVVSRHQALRTTFTTERGQVVAGRAPSAELELIDVSDEQDPELEVARISAEIASAPFDVECGPLVRAVLVRKAGEESVLELVFHHIACDGCSQAVIMRELGTLYDAYRTGQPAALGDPGVQYADFARRQRDALETQELDEVVAPWLERLAGAPEALELPTDRHRPAVPSYSGATYRMGLAPATAAAVRRFAKAQKATPFATLLSAFYVLLYRHGGQEDIVIGATTAGRNQAELQDAVGLFANTVALRGDLSGEPSFSELVGRVRETVLWAIAHEQAPLQEIVARLPFERDMSRHPLFQVFCAHVPLATLAVDGAEPYDVCPTTSRVDLTLFVEEEPGEELELAWEYSTDLFDAGTIERLAGRYLRLLEAALADPQRSIDELPLLDADERGQAIAAGRQTGHVYPVQCLHGLVADQARIAPDAVAVEFQEQQLTYAQLDARANQLAHYLLGFGVGPEVLVGICVERSLEMVIGLLGILKAGGAYVPIDPAYPPERQQYMLTHSQARVVITQQTLCAQLPLGDASVVCLDGESSKIAAMPAGAPAVPTDPEQLAYVIYTSGSTGEPKGVQVSHRALVNFLFTMSREPGLTADDVLVAVTTLSFDIAGLELYLPLINRARVVVASAETSSDPRALAELLQRSGATVMQATPTTWRMLVDSGWDGGTQLKGLCGGEALPAALAEQLVDLGIELWNMYGPTETTIWSTCSRVRKAEPITIGRPIANTSLYILDARMNPVPVGVAGELWIGGDGVARGYRGRPDLTEERFIENPFEPGRLYRTGDVAARLPDGQLEFRGRVDDQVKIRGFRIELGEIEGAIRDHPDVTDCAAMAIEVAPGDTRLAAYVVAGRARSAAADAALRERLLVHLNQQLPSYMVPAAVTLLERIPLTRNGKIDRHALPVPRWDKEAAAGFIMPETATELAVAEVWRRVLAIERVGAEDNFFRLGGHSLLAARVVTQMRERCEVEISVRALFERPTLREFASTVDAARAADPQSQPGSAELDAAEPTRPQGAHPLSFPQQQLLFFDQLTPGSVTYNAALAFRVVGPLDVSALHGALTEVFRRQEALRTVLVWGAQATPSQVVLDGWDVELPVIDISKLTRKERDVELASLLAEHSRMPFDLAGDLMLRTTLFRLGPKEHVVLFALHHMAFDAWAVEVLYREVGELYAAALKRRDAGLPELALQYRDFAAWQRERLQGELLRNELDFWRAHLAGAPTVTRLPTDRPRAAAQTFAGATHHFVLDHELTAAVRPLCAASRVTPYMLLLAAFGTALYRTSGQDDILFGGPMANRQGPGLEHLIGFFANTVAVRVRLGGDPTFDELLTRVRDSVLASYEHQEVPLELVVEAVRPERAPGVHPLFQVNFRVMVGDAPGLELAGTRTQPVPVDLGVARFELALELQVLDERIDAELTYNVALFDQPTVRRLAGDFESVLRTVTSDPRTRLLSVELASEPTMQDGVGAPGTRAAIRSFRRAGGSGR
jgi:amino acid adenylation domain-containing protein